MTNEYEGLFRERNSKIFLYQKHEEYQLPTWEKRGLILKMDGKMSLVSKPSIDVCETPFNLYWLSTFLVYLKVYKIGDLEPGHEIPGPGIIVQPISTVVLEVNCSAFVTASGDLRIKVHSSEESNHPLDTSAALKPDPVKLSIFSHRFMGIAEQMGR